MIVAFSLLGLFVLVGLSRARGSSPHRIQGERALRFSHDVTLEDGVHVDGSVGLVTYDRETLEWLKANGHRVRLDVHGLFQIKDDVTADLADETIVSAITEPRER